MNMFIKDTFIAEPISIKQNTTITETLIVIMLIPCEDKFLYCFALCYKDIYKNI